MTTTMVPGDVGVATGHVPNKCRARPGLQSPTMNSIRSDQNLSQPLSLQDSNVTRLNCLNALGPAIQYRKYLLAFFSLPLRRSRRSHLVPLSVIDEKCRRSFIVILFMPTLRQLTTTANCSSHGVTRHQKS
ncbi:hypothetical protein I7I50_00482 [Histoplasma capsulatum G186AR]|uniref:Uncharacterized protein n=1 Tax=Ajellomyces capsulatus TaxID=5037 RepID=A0A8H8CUX7_AJECA|nr:hypothetical protein I7I52_07750 [Histoplasma capsulatum]QSS72587.1 hypothetical protein I7I50_00482 [Histoplasma capsulatum G186AR]